MQKWGEICKIPYLMFYKMILQIDIIAYAGKKNLSDI